MDDNRSEAGWSAVSETDRMLFTVLSNADRVNLDAIPRDAPADVTPRIDELRTIEEEPSLPRTGAQSPREVAPVLPRPPTPVAPDRPRPPTPVADDRPRPPTPPFDPPSARVCTPPLDPSFSQPAPTPLDHSFARPPTPVQDPTDYLPPPVMQNNEAVSDPKCAEDDELTKRSLLMDLRQLEMQQDVKLSREWTMEDRAEDMMLEVRRLTLTMDQMANVNMMRDGMRLVITGIEMVNNRIGLLDLEGWSSEVCRDLQKYDVKLGRIYRKWWRRSSSIAPEHEICMSLLGSMGFHHMKRTMSKQLMSRNSRPEVGGVARGGNANGFARRARERPATPSSSEDEAPPTTH